MAYIISNFLSSIYILCYCRINISSIFKKSQTNINSELKSYSKPLVVNSISWWINNVSDRYIVTFMCGIAANGIYSISYKIPSLLSIFQTIFNQAWNISAIKEFDNDESTTFFKNVYRLYNCGIIIICSILIFNTKFIAYFLYSNEFYNAWKYVPFLMLSVVFSSLSGVLGGVFSAAKDSKTLGISTLCGAIINIVLNILLISKIGVIGAAVSTAISTFVVWLIRINKIKKLIKVNLLLKKDITSFIFILIQCLLFEFVSKSIYLYAIQCILIVLLGILYFKDIKLMFLKFKIRK